MSEATETKAPDAGARRKRLLIRAGIAFATLVVLFLLIVFVLPTPLARYVLDSQLEKIGIEHDGIDTIDIDLWNSRVRAGPVHFHSGDARQGQIGETGFDYSFGAIFKGRAFIQTFYLRGVDLFVERLKNGSIEINGVNLQELAASREGQEEEPPEKKEEGEGFNFGVDSFEFTDSTLAFQDLTGGTLVIELESLTLDRLIGWTPEEPTGFAMEGRLNDMNLSLDGTILPLSDPLRLTLSTRFTGVTLERVSRFIGPTGLKREEGSLNTNVSYDFEIHKDGRINGKVNGSYRFEDFHIETETGESVTLESALLQVAIEQDLEPDGSAAVKGQLSLEGSPLTFASTRGEAARIGSLELSFDDLDFIKGSEKRQTIFDLPETSGGAEAATAPSLIDLMIGWARELGLNTLRHNLEFNGVPKLLLKDAELKSATGEAISLDSLELNLGEVSTRAQGPQVDIAGALGLALQGMKFTNSAGLSLDLTDISADANSIELTATPEDTSLALDLALGLEALRAEDGTGLRVALEALSLGSDSLSITQSGDNGQATGPLTLTLTGIDADIPGGDAALGVQGSSLSLSLSPFTLTDQDGISSAAIDGVLEIGELSLARSGSAPLNASLGSARSDLQGFRISPLSPSATVSGAVATKLSGLSADVGAEGETLSLALEAFGNKIENLSASGFATGETQVSLTSTTELSGLTANLPLGGGQSLDASLASAQASLSSLSLLGADLQAEGLLSLGPLSAVTEGDSPQQLEIASLSLAGLKADSAGRFEADSLDIGELAASLTLPLPLPDQAADGKDGAANPAKAEEVAPQAGSTAAAGQTLKLGRLTLAPGSAIEIADKGVEPPLKASIVVNKLEAGPIDSGTPEARSDLDLSMSLNEATTATLQGWASPLKAEPDFDITSKVEGLALPLFSPYAAKAVGVDIESGALNADLGAAAKAGALEGKIDLVIDDLYVAPISEEEAEKLKANVGLPVGFAVGILKNSEGVIELGFPLTGTVDDPVVDYSEAVNKAIAGAMAAVFPLTWFGPDGNSFEMQPATFAPGGTELSEEGKAVADEMGELFSQKPGISIRACGRAARADLVALRGGPPETPLDQPDAAAPAEGEEPSAEQEAPAPAEIPDPSEAEVEALLALATERGQAVRQYLETTHGIDPARLPECRTGYSIKDGKPPRAEFQF